ncbi:uncharacterized protein EDB93DRAFT_1103248 [Suillus bovinus]|uniref:uncharacterized protein n=1 Tax=Suillus bovinus TaxID=48563 RepID=UPI001B86D8F6|nr:uncharacterized protein EDB93DRAFT_1103248 [Suillus bovinus]KAG2151012.1 hypothetical protein EDB93DRAFT_1103248 [Suillus bovinus]
MSGWESPHSYVQLLRESCINDGRRGHGLLPGGGPRMRQSSSVPMRVWILAMKSVKAQLNSCSKCVYLHTCICTDRRTLRIRQNLLGGAMEVMGCGKRRDSKLKLWPDSISAGKLRFPDMIANCKTSYSECSNRYVNPARRIPGQTHLVEGLKTEPNNFKASSRPNRLIANREPQMAACTETTSISLSAAASRIFGTRPSHKDVQVQGRKHYVIIIGHGATAMGPKRHEAAYPITASFDQFTCRS